MVEKEMMQQSEEVQQRSLAFIISVPASVWKDALMEKNRGGSGLNPLLNYANQERQKIEDFKSSLESIIRLTGNIWDSVLKDYKALKDSDKPTTPLAIKDFVEKSYMASHPDEYSPKFAKAVTDLLKEYQAVHPIAQKPAEPNSVVIGDYTVRPPKDGRKDTVVVSGPGVALPIQLERDRNAKSYAGELYDAGVPVGAAGQIGEYLEQKTKARYAQR